MNSTSKGALAAAVASIIAVSYAGAVQAAENSPVLTMKPFYAISFDVGAKRAITYFLADKATCDLVATLADPPNWDDNIPALSTERFEAAIPEGKSRRFTSSESKTLEFACQPGAHAMTVKAVEQVASEAGSAQ